MADSVHASERLMQIEVTVDSEVLSKPCLQIEVTVDSEVLSQPCLFQAKRALPSVGETQVKPEGIASLGGLRRDSVDEM